MRETAHEKCLLGAAALLVLPMAAANAQSCSRRAQAYPGFYIGGEGGLNWLLNNNSYSTEHRLRRRRQDRLRLRRSAHRVGRHLSQQPGQRRRASSRTAASGSPTARSTRSRRWRTCCMTSRRAPTITPYVGAGAGIAFVDPSLSPGCTMCSTQFAYQGIVGVGYNMAPGWRIDLDGRYYGTTNPGQYTNNNISRDAGPHLQVRSARGRAAAAASAAPAAAPSFMVFFDWDRSDLSAQAQDDAAARWRQAYKERGSARVDRDGPHRQVGSGRLQHGAVVAPRQHRQERAGHATACRRPRSRWSAAARPSRWSRRRTACASRRTAASRSSCSKTPPFIRGRPGEARPFSLRHAQPLAVPRLMPGTGTRMPKTGSGEASVDSDQLFLGQSELAGLMRAYDWAATPLGPPADLARGLKTAVRIMLTSRQPIWIGWGPELIYLYNDPYKSIIGGKHPWALGRPTSRGLARDLGRHRPDARHGDERRRGHLRRGAAPDHGAQRLSGRDLLHLLLQPDAGRRRHASAASSAPTPTTRSASSASGSSRCCASWRRATADARTWQEACERSASRRSATNPRDLPFALLYLVEPDGEQRHAGGTHRHRRGHPRGAAIAALDAADALAGRRGAARARARASSRSRRRASATLARRRLAAAADAAPSCCRSRRAARPGAPACWSSASIRSACSTTAIAASSTWSPARSPPRSPTPRPTRRSGGAPRRWPSSTAPRPRSSPTSATSSARR